MQLQETLEKEKQEYNEILGYAIAKVCKSHHLQQNIQLGLRNRVSGCFWDRIAISFGTLRERTGIEQ